MNSIFQSYRNKITNKLWGVVHLPAVGKKRGDVLISYLTEPFTHAPWEPLSNLHTNYWECFEIARLFSERGYAVDIINWDNRTFIPKKPYAVCIDSENNLERLVPYLPKNCKKVFHILISYWEAYNAAEERRLEQLEQRRGVKLIARRKVAPSKNAHIADYLEGFGNASVFGTFRQFNKPIYFIPISAVTTFPFPEEKDFNAARKQFLWIGGGGAVLKGLDVTLEVFSSLPDFDLHVCGPVYSEKDFVQEYKKELQNTPNIHVYGRIDVAGTKFGEIVAKCGAVIYPSAGEGSSGSIVQAMHAGLIPLISPETGIREDAGYISLLDSTPESIKKTVVAFSEIDPSELKARSKKIWEFARKQYTRESFSAAYAHFIDDTLRL